MGHIAQVKKEVYIQKLMDLSKLTSAMELLSAAMFSLQVRIDALERHADITRNRLTKLENTK